MEDPKPTEGSVILQLYKLFASAQGYENMVPYSFKVLQTIEKRVGAKLVAEMMENVTTTEQYELLEMSRISGFVNRAKGTGRPTKKDRRSLEAFTEPEFLDVYKRQSVYMAISPKEIIFSLP